MISHDLPEAHHHGDLNDLLDGIEDALETAGPVDIDDLADASAWLLSRWGVDLQDPSQALAVLALFSGLNDVVNMAVDQDQDIGPVATRLYTSASNYALAAWDRQRGARYEKGNA